MGCHVTLCTDLFVVRRPAIIESDPASDEENDTIEDSDKSESEESEIEPAESIAKSLFGEVSTCINYWY
jgi:hypothetical protein